MKKENSKIKENVATGVSSTGGAAAGVIIGSAVSQSVHAAEPVEPEMPEEVVVEEVVTPASPQRPVNQQPTPEPHASEPSAPEPPAPEPPIQEPPAPESSTQESLSQEPEVQVLGYETVTNEDGSQMDMALVAVDGQPVVVVDADQDGWADVMAVDENLNGTLEENEIYDVSDSQIPMQPFQDAVEMNHELAMDNSEQDYINDANVDDYMA